MKQTMALLGAMILLLTAVTGATAQTRLAAEVGALVPTGDFSDAFDTSPWFGARVEYQPSNPLGQIANVGLYVRGAYADLQPSSTLDAILAIAGGDNSMSYVEGGVGARVYSIALPFFLAAEANYGRLKSGSDTTNAFAPALGLGLSFGLAGVFVETEVRGHAFMAEGSTQNFLTFNVAAGLPF
jgi:hypothetical protein